MRKKNCKITIDYTISDNFGLNGVHREYTFNDYRIATAVANLLDNINHKWIRKKCWSDRISPSEKSFE